MTEVQYRVTQSRIPYKRIHDHKSETPKDYMCRTSKQKLLLSTFSRSQMWKKVAYRLPRGMRHGKNPLRNYWEAWFHFSKIHISWVFKSQRIREFTVELCLLICQKLHPDVPPIWLPNHKLNKEDTNRHMVV